MEKAGDSVRVLVVASAQEDVVALRHIFGHSKWTLETARTYAEAREAIETRTPPVLICESRLPDGDWTLVLAAAAERPNPPRVIVTSLHADESLWAEVLDRGGYDVLVKPFDGREVVRVVSLAWRQWKDEAERSARRTAASGTTPALGGGSVSSASG
jgi:DNA-binding NtrC family response regulator